MTGVIEEFIPEETMTDAIDAAVSKTEDELQALLLDPGAPTDANDIDSPEESSNTNATEEDTQPHDAVMVLSAHQLASDAIESIETIFNKIQQTVRNRQLSQDIQRRLEVIERNENQLEEYQSELDDIIETEFLKELQTRIANANEENIQKAIEETLNMGTTFLSSTVISNSIPGIPHLGPINIFISFIRMIRKAVANNHTISSEKLQELFTKKIEALGGNTKRARTLLTYATQLLTEKKNSRTTKIIDALADTVGETAAFIFFIMNWNNPLILLTASGPEGTHWLIDTYRAFRIYRTAYSREDQLNELLPNRKQAYEEAYQNNDENRLQELLHEDLMNLQKIDLTEKTSGGKVFWRRFKSIFSWKTAIKPLKLIGDLGLSSIKLAAIPARIVNACITNNTYNPLKVLWRKITGQLKQGDTWVDKSMKKLNEWHGQLNKIGESAEDARLIKFNKNEFLTLFVIIMQEIQETSERMTQQDIETGVSEETKNQSNALTIEREIILELARELFDLSEAELREIRNTPSHINRFISPKM